jgi:hypothetical protein
MIEGNDNGSSAEKGKNLFFSRPFLYYFPPELSKEFKKIIEAK